MGIRWKKIIREYIPGIISGGADNDPAGISTYSISGAQFGYRQLWLLVLSTPMLIAVQAMCAKLGDLKREGLIRIFREYFHPAVVWISVIILVITNTATLAADLAAIADAVGMVCGISYRYFLIPIAVILWVLIVLENYRIIEKYLFYLTFLFLAYVVSAFLARPDWPEVIRNILIPVFPASAEYFVAALGLLGTTITPSLFIWQSKQELEEHKKRSALLKEAGMEDKLVAPGFIYSNIISLFVMISTGAVLYSHGIHDIKTAADAAKALEPLAGPLSTWLFAVGIAGSGLLAVPVFATSTAYVVSELFGWRDTLSAKYSKAKGFYAVISLSILAGIVFGFSGIHPMTALLYSQVLNGVLAPFLIILLLILTNRRTVVGEKTNSLFDNFFGVLTVVVMVASTAGLLYLLIKT